MVYITFLSLTIWHVLELPVLEIVHIMHVMYAKEGRAYMPIWKFLKEVLFRNTLNRI